MSLTDVDSQQRNQSMLGVRLLRKVAGAAARVASKVPPLESRFKIQSRLDGPWPEGPFLWMHGASLGECKMLLALSQALSEDVPHLPRILITTQKAEVVPVLEAAGALAALAPLDTQAAVSKFICRVKPTTLILAENELWPGYLSAMRSLSLRPSVALVSGRFYRCFDSSDFCAIGFASMQTGADLTRFAAAAEGKLPAKTIIGGDWKLLNWARSGKPVALPENPKVDTAFVSFHTEEIPALLKMLETAMKRGEAVVLAPRRVEDVPQFREALRDRDIVIVDWPLVEKGAVSIVAGYGITQAVYGTSRAAVVGGSFARGLGVHDFWEPLRMGVSTSVGPYARGNKASVDALVREGAVIRMDSPAEYPPRPLPPLNLVQNFLDHERGKVIASYTALLIYLGMEKQKR